MKLKILLVAAIMLIAQNMQALQVIFTNNYQARIRVACAAVDSRYNASWFKAPLNYGESKRFDIPNNLNLSAISVRKDTEEPSPYKWILDMGVWRKYNIPTTGNHVIQVFLRDGSGGFAIVVDNGKKIFHQGQTYSQLPEGV